MVIGLGTRVERSPPLRRISFIAAERLGVLGGTFDPVHTGHLVAAVNVRHALELDRVLLVVANAPWQKSARRITPAADRLAVVQAAVQGTAGVEASSIEIDRGGESYTADTLEQLKRPGRELFLIVGSDVAADLHTWRRPDVVARLATLVVVTRGGSPDVDPGPPWRVEHVRIPKLDISSSDLRARAADGRPLEHLVPLPAIACIRERGLYPGPG
ncbi:MAG: nicotinate-nucleotide adenylyltransferase [Acidimicrobiales bacterium]|nr:nicotinate-nucleotide adenylyltransferase [Acidimicrobiales bacterium]